VKNLSVKRLASVLSAAVLVSGYPAFAAAFQAPLPEGAGVEEIAVRLQLAVVNGLNAIKLRRCETLHADKHHR